MTKKYLLIGGCGFIGSHIAKALIKRGEDVTSLDRRQVTENRKVNKVEYITGDYGDVSLMELLLPEYDELIHLAYATRPNTSFDNPLADLSQNLPPAVQLFELAAKHSVRIILTSSGGTVYGEACSIPITEVHPTYPVSPYGVTKLTLEKYANLYAITKGLKVKYIRPSNPYGDGQEPFVGQGFVATAMALALKGEQITIFGEKGTVRDYIYIDDLVSGVLAILDNGKDNEVYNIGSEIGLTNLEVLDHIKRFFPEGLSVQHDDERGFDVKVNILSSRKLQQLNWQPKVDFSDGLKSTYYWLKQYLEG